MHIISFPQKVFRVFNALFLASVAVLCLIPMIHVLVLSLSSSNAVSANEVTFIPVDFTWKSYQYVMKNSKFWSGFEVTVFRVLVGTVINMALTILIAYPLSKEPRVFKQRTFYVWYFVLTMLFNGGLIPWYMTIRATGLLDSVWALVIPSAVPIFNMILLLNFFRGLPKELEEASFIDGAGPWTALWRIFVPLSMPALATITLFTVVGHWNSWFDGLILMNSPDNYPLTSYLQTVVINVDLSRATEEDIELLKEVSDRTTKAAQIFIGMLPILLIYPFLQRFFVKGIVLGSVKE